MASKECKLSGYAVSEIQGFKNLLVSYSQSPTQTKFWVSLELIINTCSHWYDIYNILHKNSKRQQNSMTLTKPYPPWQSWNTAVWSCWFPWHQLGNISFNICLVLSKIHDHQGCGNDCWNVVLGDPHFNSCYHILTTSHKIKSKKTFMLFHVLLLAALQSVQCKLPHERTISFNNYHSTFRRTKNWSFITSLQEHKILT